MASKKDICPVFFVAYEKGKTCRSECKMYFFFFLQQVECNVLLFIAYVM